MKRKEDNKEPKGENEGTKPGDEFAYPPGEDIYVNAEKEEDRDTDDLTKMKAANPPADGMNEKSFREDKTGKDLDVPGAELDDEAEETGSEDEENNSYSLGGDNHNN